MCLLERMHLLTREQNNNGYELSRNYNSYIGIIVGDKQKQLDAF